MTNEEKAKKLAEEYFPISDWDVDEITSEYNQNDCKQATLEMAEWKDQQFKKYLETKRKDILAVGDEPRALRAEIAVLDEIINELFPKTEEQDNSENDE